MRNLKVLILVFGALGLVSLLFNIDHLKSLFDHEPLEAIILLAGFGLPLLMGLMGVVRPPFQTWQAVVALVGFSVHAIRGKVWRLAPDILHVSTSTKLLLVAIIGGVITSALALAKPEDWAPMLWKRSVVAAGVLGFLGTFLPVFAGDWSSSLWAARVTVDGVHTYLIQLAFLGAAALGVHGIRHAMPRWKSFAAIVCFALPMFEFARGVSGNASVLQLLTLGLGAKLVGVGTLGGTIAAIVAATQHEPVPRASVIT